MRATDRFRKKRDAILDASTVLLNQRGVKGLTLADAAAAVGLSTTSVTYYFKRKDDLAAACMMRGIGWLQAAAEIAVTEPTPAARLHRLLELYFERVRLMAIGEGSPLPSLADVRALKEPHRAEVIEAFAKVFRKVRGIFDAPELIWL
ncbi:MAG: TetR/AcrR family transcriptional regulator, partial [Phenylobacterium sp.]